MPTIAEQERLKLQKLIELGEAVHTLLRTGQMDDPELMRISKQIIALDKDINAKLGKKPPSKDDGVCPECGAALNGALFCTACGLNINEFFSRPVLSCVACGMSVSEDDAFCGVCGSKREG